MCAAERNLYLRVTAEMLGHHDFRAVVLPLAIDQRKDACVTRALVTVLLAFRGYDYADIDTISVFA